MQTEFRMDATHSNAFAKWKQIGEPADPNARQRAELDKAAALACTTRDRSVAVHDGAVELHLSLPRQGVALIRLRER